MNFSSVLLFCLFASIFVVNSLVSAAMLNVPATDGKFSAAFKFSGKATTHPVELASFDFTDNVGTMVIRKKNYDCFCYNSVTFYYPSYNPWSHNIAVMCASSENGFAIAQIWLGPTAPWEVGFMGVLDFTHGWEYTEVP